MKHIIAPSMLSADFANLRTEVELINQSKAQWFHLDVMDGVFVPNISFGFPVIKAIKKYAKKPLDVHLMIEQPERYIAEFKDAGADRLTVHYEASPHLHRTLQSIRAAGMKSGVALNPHTPVSVLEDVLSEVDLVCLMSVNPGFGGQKFITNTYKKIPNLKQMIKDRDYHTLIEIDGGVDLHNYKRLLVSGADVLVVGHTVFSSANPLKTIEALTK
ncbi:MAG TPA: ribulose-phosphate 3-epimerase [Bacteroidia bacterium]